MKTATIVSLLRNRNFLLYSVGNVLSLTGNWVQLVAVSWLIWEMTHSTAWLGIMAASQFAPIFLVGPYAGVLADRFERRKLVIFSNIGGLLCSLAMFLIYEAGTLTILVLFLLRAAQSVFVSLGQPARMAIVPKLAPPDQQTAAIALGTINFNLARLVGPLLSGVVVTAGGMGMAMLFNSISYLAFIFTLLGLRLPEDGLQSGRRRRNKSSWREAREGIAYACSNRVILTMIIMYGSVVLFARPVMQMLPAYVDKVFGQGMLGLSLLTSAAACGSLLGGLAMTRSQLPDSLMRVVLFSNISIALTAIGFASMSNFYAAMAFAVVLGAMIVVFGISAQSLVQHEVGDEARGRILSLWFMLHRGGPALGAFIFGFVAEFAGMVWPVVAGGVLVMLTSLALRHYRHRAVAADGFDLKT